MDFLVWIESIGLTRSTADKYWGAIVGRLSDWAAQDIAKVTSLSDFKVIADAVRHTHNFKGWNKTGNGMYSAALDRYEQYLSFVNAQFEAYSPYANQIAEIESGFHEPFDPNGREDARERVLREIVQRRGQQKFRKALIAAYEGRCAITGCSVTPLLEAAHITPYLGQETNSTTNGLLLRADIHTLWDLGLIALDPKDRTVWVSPKITDSTYRVLARVPLMLPLNSAQWPSSAALAQQWNLAHTKLTETSSKA